MLKISKKFFRSIVISSTHSWYFKNVKNILILLNFFFIFQNMNESGVVTMQDDFFMRYENDFSQTSWGSKTFNFMAANKSLSLDIENISIEEFFHY